MAIKIIEGRVIKVTRSFVDSGMTITERLFAMLERQGEEKN